MKTHLVPAVCCLAALLSAGGIAAGDYDPNGEGRPPWFCVMDVDATPADCPILAPGPANSPCAGHWQECTCVPKLYRRDYRPDEIDPGRPETVNASQLECNFCEPRCLTANPPTTVHVCTQTITVNLARTFQLEFAPEVQVGLEELRVKFGEKFGWTLITSLSFQFTLGSTQMPSCLRTMYTLIVQVRKDAIYRIRHEYAWFDVLVESPDNICGEVNVTKVVIV